MMKNDPASSSDWHGPLRALLLWLSLPASMSPYLALGEPAAPCSVSLAQNFEASGGQAWARFSQLHLHGVLDQYGNGQPYSSTTDLRGGRWLDRRRTGPFELAEGFDGEARWSEWKPGDVIVSNDPAKRGETQTERYLRMRAHWLTQRMPAEITCQASIERDGHRFAVYRLRPEGGKPLEIWIDAETRLIARRVDRNGSYERIERYDDYRWVDGLRLPFRVEQTDYEGNVSRLVVSRIELATSVDPAAFARPAIRLDDYSFPAGRDAIEVPLRLLNNHLYVPVSFNRREPHWMILDTGAYCLITPRLADAMGLKPSGEVTVRGAGPQTKEIALTKLDTVSIGGVVLRDQRCDIIDLGAFEEFEGVEQYGLLGYEVYRRFAVRQNHAAGTLGLIRTSVYEPGKGEASVPFEFHDTAPVVAGTLDGMPGRFVVDTGSRAQLSPFNWFIARHDLRSRYPHGIVVISGFGVGGAVRSHVARATELRLGEVRVAAPLVDLPISASIGFASEEAAALVGTGLLRRFPAVTFDYERRRIVFAHAAAESDFDRSGVTLQRSPEGFEVIEVVAGSPAAEAGLTAGDVLTRIAGRASREWSLPDLREHLRVSSPGTSVPGTVLHHDTAREFQLTLRDLL